MIRGALLSFGALLAVAIGGVGAAQAQSFDFSYTSAGVSVMGIFNTTPTATSGRYLINSITNGMRGGNAITLLAPSGFLGNDNILYFPLPGFANGYYLDTDGFSYSAGTAKYNLAAFPRPDTYLENSSTVGGGLVDDLVVTEVGAPAPIPGGGPLSFLALGLAGVIWRRKAIVAFVWAHALAPCR